VTETVDHSPDGEATRRDFIQAKLRECVAPEIVVVEEGK
jgi:hypothetical protein